MKALVLLLLMTMTTTAHTPQPSTNTAMATTTSHSSVRFPEAESLISAKRLHNRIFAASIFIAFLVVVFSALVWWSGNRVQDAERRVSAREIQELKTEAEALKLETETAKKEAAVANAGAATAHVEAAKANERAGVLEVEAAQAREKAAVAERRFLELQRRVSDRHLSEEQRTKLRAILGGGPSGTITIICLGGDPEPCAFAEDIATALRESGWNVIFGEQEHGMLLVGSAPRGLFLRLKPPGTPIAALLQRALAAIGLEAPAEPRPEFSENEIGLLVGYK